MIEIFTQADLRPFRPSDLEQLFKFVPAQPPMLAEFELEAEHIYLAINKDGAWLRLPKCDLYGAA